MPNFYKIPLSPNPQRFVITLGGIDYQLKLVYRNVSEGGWVLDIADARGTPIVNGVPLTTGADLLHQYKHLGFGGRLWVQGAIDPDAVPTFDGLGVDSFLFWVTD